MANSERFKVVSTSPLQQKMEEPEEKKNGRPKKTVLPAIPGEVYEQLSDIEKEHFDFLVLALKKELPNISPLEQICVVLAAMEYINTLRLEVEQLKTGRLVTMSRQHPAMQLRAWIDAALKRHKNKKEVDEDEKNRNEFRNALLGLSAASNE